MKKWGILLLAALAAALVFTSCEALGIAQSTDLAAYVKTTNLATAGATAGFATQAALTAAQTALANQTAACMECHTSSGAKTDSFKLAVASFEESGHSKGIRHLTESADELAANEDSAGCSKCHTDQGFRAWVANGSTAATLYGFQSSVSGTYSATGTLYTPYTAAKATKPTATQTTADLTQTAYINYGYMANYSSLVGYNQYTNPTGSAGVKNNCFTCHDPHVSKTMALRTVAAVPLTSAMDTSTTSTATFDGGSGNLCAQCHQDRASLGARQYALGNDVLTSGKWTIGNANVAGGTPHQGVQADFMMGVDNAASTGSFTNGYTAPAAGYAKSPHLVGDSCVTCHVTNNSGNSPENSSHGMYLTTFSTAGTSSDNLTSCKTCHTAATAAPTTAPTGAGTTAATADWSKSTYATFVWSSTILTKVDTAYQALLTFYGNPLNFYSSATAATLQSALVTGTTTFTAAYGAIRPASWVTTATMTASSDATYTPSATSHLYRKDWTTASGRSMTKAEAQGYWNLMAYAIDNSRGVHNPVYAAQMLYDAIVAVGADTVAFPGKAALVAANPWTARP